MVWKKHLIKLNNFIQKTFWMTLEKLSKLHAQMLLELLTFVAFRCIGIWGKRIFEEEQHGKERADYGAYIVKTLAEKLEVEYGSGFSERQLKFCRQFYRIYPIRNALRSQLNRTQYRLLIQISDPDKREYQLCLPPKEELVKEVEDVKQLVKKK